MYVRFWGTRGSIATPGPQTAHYGGNTSCVEVRADDGTLMILDCGTGARELGLHLLRSGQRPLRLHLLIGHTHWDHIQGFPFFDPVFLPDTELNLYAPRNFQHSLEEVLAGQMQAPYFPVKFHDLRSCIRYTELEEECFRLGEVLVETQYLNHTAPTIAYRLSSGGASVAYVTDHEPFWNAAGQVFHHPGDQRHIDFLKGTDLIIHDAQYTQEEYRRKMSWGHSTIEYATDVAVAAGASRLALFHHDPSHDDATIRRIEKAAHDRIATHGGALEVFAAAEGLELEVCDHGRAPTVVERLAPQRRSLAGRRVMVVSADASHIIAAIHALAEDGIMLMYAADGRTALAQAPAIAPDLVIIDQRLPDRDGATIIRSLRARIGQHDLPIILLANGPMLESLLCHGTPTAIDYLATPFKPPMLRAHVRAWLIRTSTPGYMRSNGQLRQARRVQA
jgi:phosphoribosyl 1,2-cyclic phosphodiesterase